MHPDEQRTVRLCGVPTALYMRLHVHLDDLLRELALLGVSDDYGLAPCWEPARAQAEAAERAGRDHVDLELSVPPNAAERLSSLFEQADQLCREGLLLGADTPPALRRFRNRMLAELAHALRDGDGPS